MTRGKEPRKVIIQVRMTQTEREQLDAAALSEGRPLANYLLYHGLVSSNKGMRRYETTLLDSSIVGRERG